MTTDHDAEMDALRNQLVEAGLIEVCTDDQGDRLPRVHGYESDKVAVPLGVTESLSSDTK